MFITINKARFEAFTKRVDFDLFALDKKEALQAQIVRFLGELFPTHTASIQALVQSNSSNITSKQDLLDLLQYVSTVLQYRPEWVSAPMQEVAHAAAEEAAKYPSFAATAKLLGKTDAEQHAQHLLCTASKIIVIPSRFAGLNEAYSFGVPTREYEQLSLFFGFVSGLLPTQEGNLTLIIPIYAHDGLISLFSDSEYGKNLEDAWNKWMAIAQYVGHDDLHHLYRGFEKTALAQNPDFAQFNALLTQLDANTSSAIGLDAREVFARSLHAARMQMQEDAMPKLLTDFLNALEIAHAAMQSSQRGNANQIAFFLIASCFDHAIADRHQLSKEVLDLFENAMNKMKLSVIGSSGKLFDRLHPSSDESWKSISADDSRKNLNIQLDDSLRKGAPQEISGLQALWYAQQISGSLTAQYAFQDRRMGGKICRFEGQPIDAARMAEKIGSALISASKTLAQTHKEARADGLSF